MKRKDKKDQEDLKNLKEEILKKYTEMYNRGEGLTKAQVMKIVRLTEH